MNNQESDQLSFFDLNEEHEQKKEYTVSGKLDVVKMEYSGAESVTWEELFSGYDSIKAITFSSGINFVYRLLGMFKNAEVIFGCEDVLSFSMNEILAYQSKLLEEMRKNSGKSKAKILERIDNGSVHFYVARTRLSHEKIYLLSSEDGRRRVIMGSANMSYNAFGGMQRENICYVDGDSAYEWYLGVFNSLKEDSTDEITKKAIEVADLEENMTELPISQTVRSKKIITIEQSKESKENIQFIMDTKNIASKLSQIVPKPDRKTGRILIDSDNIVKIKRKLCEEATRERDLRSEYPQLLIDIDNERVLLNEKELNLYPTKEEIQNDVRLFLSYMEGYSKFHGDFEGMQSRYFEFANWFFCSPFMAPMRDIASRYDQNRLPYPVFGLLYGQSKAGKTSFLETLLKMMIGQKPKLAAPEFTRSSIEGLKRTVQGAPIIVDDLTNARFNQHAIETIKNDDFGVGDHLTTYSAVVISANEDVKAVAPEVIRRTVICRVEAGLTNTEVMKSNVVRNVQQKIGTSFYREYLRRMLDMMPSIIDVIKSDEQESAPDILKYSSEIICDIIEENSNAVPEYVRRLNLEDYFGESVTGKFAIKTIRNAWKVDKKSFEVVKKNNELRYNAAATYEADRLLKELPETLEARKSREWVVMNLEKAKEFFGIDFKQGFMPWSR